MAEYIDREKMLKYLEENNTDVDWLVGQYNADWIYSFIETQLTADVEKVRHGAWIVDKETHICKTNGFKPSRQITYKCSGCGHKSGKNKGFKYCPRCGAKMDGGKEE